MSDQNLKPMNKEELEKHIEKDFLPILLSTFPNISDLVLENARLQAEVERLRKAGDELLHEWSSGDETNGRNFMKGLVIWNAAKEGKPSV